ncbi:conserved hypothetical protein [Ricinus communis]|uniref:Uncharacterized protein n=1 Tax=Ricinus communis TaxID=3988 RepID=B9S8C3_RICCO|nr:conserved hypothetical protein [Ricinus communis]
MLIVQKFHFMLPYICKSLPASTQIHLIPYLMEDDQPRINRPELLPSYLSPTTS